MLTGWFGTAEAGSRASAEDGGNRSDPDDDTQIMEPDQGNGTSFPYPRHVARALPGRP